MCAKVRQLAHGMFLGFITITAPASQDVIQFGSGHLLIAEGKRPALETRGDDGYFLLDTALCHCAWAGRSRARDPA